MTKPDFVYVTYIATTPEKVWQAFTDPAVMRQYWYAPHEDCGGHTNVSDWRPGSRWEHQSVATAGRVDIVGKVVESAPPHRLVYTWARPSEESDASRHSRVAIDIEPNGPGVVRVTVTHTDLDAKMLTGISGGWPKVLSNLKTLLETGRALPGSGSV
ncbi:MAG TPA: SRPBCC family protein [Rhizobacter sp.]|nr:SRPBCC family protein [Rhizobacter sp.]